MRVSGSTHVMLPRRAQKYKSSPCTIHDNKVSDNHFVFCIVLQLALVHFARFDQAEWLKVSMVICIAVSEEEDVLRWFHAVVQSSIPLENILIVSFQSTVRAELWAE